MIIKALSHCGEAKQYCSFMVGVVELCPADLFPTSGSMTESGRVPRVSRVSWLGLHLSWRCIISTQPSCARPGIVFDSLPSDNSQLQEKLNFDLWTNQCNNCAPQGHWETQNRTPQHSQQNMELWESFLKQLINLFSKKIHKASFCFIIMPRSWIPLSVSATTSYSGSTVSQREFRCGKWGLPGTSWNPDGNLLWLLV